jgi:U3 small nucleolar RNA-associated protein MPP10
MESALPTSKSAASMLAPEEVFSASTSSLTAPSELTPAEKRARRTKERKLRKRQRDVLEKNINKLAKPKGAAGVKREKKVALNTLVKHGKGVTVVGKESVSQGKHKKR